MSYSIGNLSIKVYWYNRPLESDDAFAQMRLYLQQLQALSPLFSRFYVPDGTHRKHVPIELDFSNFDQVVAAALPHDVTYKNADPADKGFSMACTSWMGFGTMFATVPDARQTGCWIDISCGSDDPKHANRIDIGLSPELEATDLLRILLDNMVHFWKPDMGVITRAAMHKAVTQPLGDVRVGWLTYLSNPAAARVLPASMFWYALEDGIVVQAAERPGFSDDADYVRKVMLVRDTL